MRKAYYLYRAHPYLGVLYPNKVLNLITDTKLFHKYLPDTKQICLAQKYFPNGLSPHGLSSLICLEKCEDDFIEPIVEIIFELVRQQHFPHSPSRLTSFYASESIDEAEKWCHFLYKVHGHKQNQVPQSLWEIKYETESKLYDAKFLDITTNDSFSYLAALENAHNYWNGSMSNNPLPELLIPYPVTVIRLLRQFNSM